jgi:hypothetical protein
MGDTATHHCKRAKMGSGGGHKVVKKQYGWICIPHNAGFGFLDIAGPALGVFASLDRF